jgi:hypothetical protein
MTDRTTALNSLEKLFDEEILGPTFTSMSDLHETLRVASKSRMDLRKKHQDLHGKFEKGFLSWIDEVCKTTRKFVTTVALIAKANPERKAEDLPSWARSFVRQLLDNWWNSAPNKKFYGWPTTWIMEVCDGSPDFDSFESGRLEPWCAPVWTLRFARGKNISDRLSRDQTKTLIRLKQGISKRLFENALTTGEHEARVTLATQPAFSRIENSVSIEDADVDLRHAADFSYVDYGGARHYLRANQKIVIRALHVRRMRGELCVHKSVLCSELGGGEVKDSFKNSPLWRTLVLPNRSPKGTYSLNLAPASKKPQPVNEL